MTRDFVSFTAVILAFRSVPDMCCCPVTKSCLTLCDLMDCSMPGSSVLHYLLQFAQIHVYLVGGAI